jgi:hypothetical protein
MLMFPHLYTPRPVVQGGEPRYSMTLLFDEEAQKRAEYRELKKLVADAIDEKFGAGKARDAEWQKRMKFRTPFRDAGEKDKYTGFVPGHIFIAPWSKTKPDVVDGRAPKPQIIPVAADVWAGQLARAYVSAFAYQQSGNVGASFMLDMVQITKANMPRMDGRMKAEDAFPPVEGELVDSDSDIPF